MRNIQTLALLIGLVFTGFQSSFAQFSGAYDPSNWAFSSTTSGGDGSVDVSGAPGSITLNGSDAGSSGGYEQYSITILTSGTISFDYNHVNPDIDDAWYVINGSTTYITDNGSGSLSNISVTAGDVFGFRVENYDDCCGRGVLTISNFSGPSGCSMTASITGQTNVSCNGGTNGALTVTASNGTANYDYAWSNGSSTSNSSSATNTIASLSAGSYTVTVTDNNSCTDTASATITQPLALSVGTAIDSSATCSNPNGGGITASATGGTEPYSFVWSNTDTTASIEGIVAGIYTVTATDSNGCSALDSDTIAAPQNCTPIWNGTGNWTDNPNWNTAPGTTDSVVVQTGTVTVDTDAVVNDLTLESGSIISVASGNTLTVSGNYINNGGTFDVQDGGTLVFQGELRKGGAKKMKTFGQLKIFSGSITLGN